MAKEIYVISSIILSVIVVGFLYHGSEHPGSIADELKCPRCGAMMKESGGGIGERFIYYFVPPLFVRTCPRCGYSERSWRS